jgi:chromosome segregation ATPase
MRTWLAAGGFALALGTTAWLVMGDSATSPSDTNEARRPSPAKTRAGSRAQPPDATLEDRVASLEAEVDGLRREIRALRSRPVAVASASASDLEASAERPELEQAVRSVVEQERAREAETRLERRRDRMEERLESLSAELAERAGLGREQHEQIAGLWSTEAEEILPLISAARTGDVSFRDIREQIDAIRARTDEQAASLLSAGQLEVYEELRTQPFGGGGRGGRRDRGER